MGRKKGKALEDMAHAMYDDDDVAATVIADADAKGTRKDIERGKLSLPDPADAVRFHAQRVAEQAQQQKGDE